MQSVKLTLNLVQDTKDQLNNRELVFGEIQLFLFLMNEIKVSSKSATAVCTHIFLLRL